MHRRYLAHMESKTTHERRQHAIQVATVATALLFAVWVTSLGARLTDTPIASNENGQTQLSASAAQSQLQVDSSKPRLEVSSTSVLY